VLTPRNIAIAVILISALIAVTAIAWWQLIERPHRHPGRHERPDMSPANFTRQPDILGPRCAVHGCGGQDCDCRADCGHEMCQMREWQEDWTDAQLAALGELGQDHVAVEVTMHMYQRADGSIVPAGSWLPGSPGVAAWLAVGNLRRADWIR
jgi:hypothetical protein